jgi:hypothetical protein
VDSVVVIVVGEVELAAVSLLVPDGSLQAVCAAKVVARHA